MTDDAKMVPFVLTSAEKAGGVVVEAGVALYAQYTLPIIPLPFPVQTSKLVNDKFAHALVDRLFDVGIVVMVKYVGELVPTV